MAQTRSVAIGCIAAVVLVGAIVACGVGGIFLLGLNSVAEQAETEGVEFGKHTDQRGCQSEAFRRLLAATRSRNLVKRRETELFLYGCFQTSRSTANFCTNAPQEDGFFAVQQWAKEQCRKDAMEDDDACVSLFMEVSDVCLGKTKRKAK